MTYKVHYKEEGFAFFEFGSLWIQSESMAILSLNFDFDFINHFKFGLCNWHDWDMNMNTSS